MLAGFFIFYWTYAGAWVIIIDHFLMISSIFEINYKHVSELLFQLRIDHTYALTNIYYGFFLLTYSASMFFLFKKGKKLHMPKKVQTLKITIRFKFIFITTSLFFMAISLFFIKNQIIQAIANQESIYSYIRFYSDQKFYSLHIVSNIIGLMVIFINSIVCFVDYLQEKSKLKLFLLLISFLVLIVFLCYLVFLGNKREIMYVGTLCILFYLSIKPKHLVIISSIILLIGVPLFFNDSLRAAIPKILYDQEINNQTNSNQINHLDFTELLKSAANHFIFSNEMFYAHYSMYGILKYKVPVNYGVSLKALIESVIPRFIYPNRSDDVYKYYIQSIGNKSKQGFTIHHCSGWYINLGIIGIFTGAILISYLISYSYILYTISKKNQLLFLIAYCGVIASLPQILRAGPESYKSLIFTGIIFPVMIMIPISLSDKNED